MTEIIETLWQDMHADLVNFICRQVPTCADAEDIVQDVFIKIHRSLGSVHEMKKLESWVYQIARHSLVDFYRQRKPANLLDDLLVSPVEDDPTDDAELAAYLLEVIDSLPEAYRQAILQTDITGLSQVEYANTEGISISCAKSRVQRARRMVRDVMLECCHVEFDRRGGIVETRPRCCCCE